MPPMVTKLKLAQKRVEELEKQLAEARAELRQLAVAELRRDVSASRIAREIGKTRATVSNWGRKAGLRLARVARNEPLQADE